MNRRLGWGIGVLCAALLVGAFPAAAGIVTQTFTDWNSWNNATNGDQTSTFEGLAPVGGTDPFNTSSGFTDADGASFVGFYGASYNLQVVNPSGSQGYYNWGSGASLRSGNYVSSSFTPYIQATLPVNSTAFGVDLMTGSPNAQIVQVKLSDGELFNINTANNPTRTFFGITASAPITSVTFTILGTDPANSSYLMMDNFAVGFADLGAPEGGTLMLIGMGLASMIIIWRKQTQ